MNWHLTLAIAGTILLVTFAVLLPFLLSACHAAGRADDAAEDAMDRLAKQGWPHLPRDRSRGLLPRHGAALTQSKGRDHAS